MLRFVIVDIVVKLNQLELEVVHGLEEIGMVVTELDVVGREETDVQFEADFESSIFCKVDVLRTLNERGNGVDVEPSSFPLLDFLLPRARKTGTSDG